MNWQTLDVMAATCHDEAKKLGWYAAPVKTDVEMLMMTVTELAETVDELRQPEPRMHYAINGKPEGWGVEVADAVIRLLDYCAYRKIPIGHLIEEKLRYNRTRGFKHGKKF